MQYHSGNRKLVAAEISNVEYIKYGGLVNYPQPKTEKTAREETINHIMPIKWK